MSFELAVSQAARLYEQQGFMIACEAMFALPHKASFDAGQSNQRFAALNKIDIVSFGGEVGYARFAALATFKPHPLPSNPSFKRTSRNNVSWSAQLSYA